jgi:catechol 2,3-dioxygenase-like lactoylglutathione lyase family enzyme
VSRVQLALNVRDLDGAVDFYSKLFRTQPAKRRPGYANFAVTDPPLKLVLIENAAAEAGPAGVVNHLGVEVDSTAQVAAARARLVDDGLATVTEEGVACCYAVQDKAWVDDPDGNSWEVYVVLGDAEIPVTAREGASHATAAACCGPRPDLAAHQPVDRV